MSAVHHYEPWEAFCVRRICVEATVPDVPEETEWDETVRDRERADIVDLLRREECDHLRCNRPEMAAYVAELIGKLERGEHR